MSRILRLAALQKRVGSHIPPVEFERLQDQGIDLVCLPEYLFIPDGVKNQIETAPHRQAILDLLALYSHLLVGAVVGGSLIEEENGRYYNSSHIFYCGRHLGFYRKRHLTGREQALGLTPGDRPLVFEVRSFRLAILICADVLFPASYQELAPLVPDVIAVPTVSPHLDNDTVEAKYRRDQAYFLDGAKATGAIVIKACGVGTLMGGKLQGRSLICSPQGVLARISPRRETLEGVLTVEVNLDELPKPLDQPQPAPPAEFLLPPGLGRNR